MDRAEIVSQLAALGSIDALLASHQSLEREEIAAALSFGAHLIAEHDQPLAGVSPLYRAYNGFMLGLFTGSAMLFDAQDDAGRHEFAFRRVSEFLLEFANELGRDLELEGAADNLEDAIERRMRELDEDVADYYLLALATFRLVVLRATGESAASDTAQAHHLLHKLGHPPVIFKTAIDDISPSQREDGESTLQHRFTACLRLLREILAGLAVEEDTCFVALPFKEPYEDRYLNFYRAIARAMGHRAMRAWGGLGAEDHHEMLLALMAKSGSLLAEVTEPNANVTLEVGFALGQSKSVFLVAEEDSWRRTANIQLDWVYPYRTDDDGWEFEAARRAGLYFTTLNALRRPGLIPSWSGRPLDILQLLVNISGDGGDGRGE